jgi:hypothetical protein
LNTRKNAVGATARALACRHQFGRAYWPVIHPLPAGLYLHMTLCPIALVAGCEKCPAFKICPLKTVIGDMPGKSDAAPSKPAAPARKRSGGSSRR